MIIIYRDNLGYIEEQIDEYNISFCDGYCYFNDKKIKAENVKEIIRA